MKERFETMTLDQLDAVREVLCYLYPPMETPCSLLDELEEVRDRKLAEYQRSGSYQAMRAENSALYAALFQTRKEETT